MSAYGTIHGGPLDGQEIIDDGRWKIEDVDPETQMIHVYQRTSEGRYEYRGAQPSGFLPNTQDDTRSSNNP